MGTFLLTHVHTDINNDKININFINDDDDDHRLDGNNGGDNNIKNGNGILPSTNLYFYFL